ncbi:MAG: TIGR04283 family arsenosugar biosynthesis glycosyltransferase [Planctomycetales bacterium]|nr:TIGR04283 family arsenosugar biosynthesis glycosyltransferase [Planctomycetales bacterium]
MCTSVSVIIPALNEAANIQKAVSSAWHAGADEVIVVDGGSRDETASLADSAGGSVLQSPLGRARQQNHGANAAIGDTLLFLHADCWLDSDCIRQVRDAIASGKLHGGFRQSIANSGSVYRLLEIGNNLRVRCFSMVYGDQAIWVHRELFDRVGQFADIALMEDVKLSEGLRKHSRATLLPGCLHVSARRWQTNGPIRQTFRNWSLMLRYKTGVSPDDLRKFYRCHDE